MAWYSYTIAMPVPETEIVGVPDAMEIFQRHSTQDYLVSSVSRNGVLIAMLGRLWAQSSSASTLYLLNDIAFLPPADIPEAAAAIEAFLEELKN